MSNKIRVLALNDDNHETSFHTEWCKDSYYTHMDFIRKLAEPHTYEYEVRCVYLLNIDDNNPLLNKAFDIVCSGSNHSLRDYFLAFEHLWEISKRNMFVEEM